MTHTCSHKVRCTAIVNILSQFPPSYEPDQPKRVMSNQFQLTTLTFTYKIQFNPLNFDPCETKYIQFSKIPVSQISILIKFADMCLSKYVPPKVFIRKSINTNMIVRGNVPIDKREFLFHFHISENQQI